MPKYKKLTTELVEGFIDRMFGRIATKTGQAIAKDMARKDPKVGKLLSRAANLAKEAEKHLKSMSKDDREKYISDLEDELGIT